MNEETGTAHRHGIGGDLLKEEKHLLGVTHREE